MRAMPLGEFVELKRGYDLPAANRVAGPFPIVSSSGVSDHHNEAKVPGPGVVTGRYGTIGEVFYLTSDYWPLNTTLYVRDFKGNHPRFVYYLLQTVHWQQFNDKSGVPGINRNDAHKELVRVPALKDQRRIADVLGTLDDKIELNRRMNETLEVMAQAIFRDWFVDFGPTRRKLAGTTDPVAIMGGLVQDPTRAAELTAMFPAAFDNGLPEGWEERPLDQIAEFLNGLALQKYPAIDGQIGFPVIKIAELRGGVTAKSGRAAKALPDKYVVRDGDFLFSWSGSLMAKFWTEGDGALNQHLFKVTSEEFPAWFFSRWVLFHMPEFQTIAASKATTMGHIQRSHLSAARTVCPPPETIKSLGRIMAPLLDCSIHNGLENRTLAATRDLLLPKLISGEIRLHEAEALAEAAQ